MEKTRETLYDSLQAAKCPEDLTKECLGLAEKGGPAAMLPKLSWQRRKLLNRLHEYQDALDCLDCLAHEIRKNQSK